jgi:hypothetical protein
MPMMLDRKRAIMWLIATVRGPFQLVQLGGGVIHVIVIESVATQEVGYLLDEALALGKESEFIVWVSYCGGHDGNAVLDFFQLGIEVFLGKGWRANRVSKEAEAGGEFGREGCTQNIYAIWFGRILGDSVSDGSG